MMTTRCCLVVLLVGWLGIGRRILVDGFALRPTRHVERPRSPLAVSAVYAPPIQTRSTTALASARLVDTIPAAVEHASPPTLLDDDDDEAVPTTLRAALRLFFVGPYHGPRVIVGLLTLLCLWRVSLMLGESPLSWADGVAGVAMIVVWCFQEHALHGHVLHSDMDWYGKSIHQAHHARPYHHVSLDPAWLMVAWLSAAHALLRVCTPLPLPLVLSSTIGYASAGLWYEFLHYIVHTRVRFPRGSYFQRMKDHHARHHNIDHHYWLGFSVPAVDTLWGTNPTVAYVRRQQQQQAAARKALVLDTPTVVGQEYSVSSSEGTD